MKNKGLLSAFIIILSFWAYTASFNISVQEGEDSIFISENEWFEYHHPEVNEFGESENSESPSAQAFFSFLSEMADKPFHNESISFLDTTGDGVNEKVTQTIIVKNNLCFVSNIIEKEGITIWNDQRIISKWDAELLLESKNIVDNFTPYALFYTGMVKSKFLEKPATSEDFNAWKYRFLSQIHEEVELEKGYFVFELKDSDKGVFKWDDLSKSFVKLCCGSEFIPLS